MNNQIILFFDDMISIIDTMYRIDKNLSYDITNLKKFHSFENTTLEFDIISEILYLSESDIAELKNRFFSLNYQFEQNDILDDFYTDVVYTILSLICFVLKIVKLFEENTYIQQNYNFSSEIPQRDETIIMLGAAIINYIKNVDNSDTFLQNSINFLENFKGIPENHVEYEIIIPEIEYDYLINQMTFEFIDLLELEKYFKNFYDIENYDSSYIAIIYEMTAFYIKSFVKFEGLYETNKFIELLQSNKISSNVLDYQYSNLIY